MIPLLLALSAASSSARAAPLDPDSVDASRFPWQATVHCDDCPTDGPGVLRIELPRQLRSAADPTDGTDLALLDADGRPLGFAVARGRAPIERDPATVLPTTDRDRWRIETSARPVDALELDLRASEWVVTVTASELRDGAWVAVGQPQLLWQTRGSQQRRLELPATRGPLQLELQHHLSRPWGSPRVTLLSRGDADVPDLRWTTSVAAQAMLESGQVRVVALLDQPLPVERVRLQVDDPAFERSAAAWLLEDELLDSIDSWSLDQTLRRVRVGGAALDELDLAVQGPPSDTLIVVTESEGRLPLELSGLELSMPGEALLVPEPGPGPWTLLAGAEAGTAPTADVQVALPELARMADATVQPGARQPNPAWIPPEVRAGLVQPSTELDLRGMRWAHDVHGTGLSRIPLSAEILADSHWDLSDLRLVDADGRQVPFLKRRRPLDAAVALGPPERTEDGATSRLRVAVPTAGESGDGVPLSSVCLGTEAPLFDREVRISRVRGNQLEPLRMVSWVGEDRPLRLCLELSQPVGTELIVELDNGDDPPLPIEEITATTPAWELLAVLPEQPLRLVYGDPERAAPDYDLALLREALTARVSVVAELGPREALEPPPPSPAERGMVLAGLVVLALGLGGLVIGVVRAVPEEEES